MKGAALDIYTAAQKANFYGSPLLKGILNHYQDSKVKIYAEISPEVKMDTKKGDLTFGIWGLSLSNWETGAKIFKGSIQEKYGDADMGFQFARVLGHESMHAGGLSHDKPKENVLFERYDDFTQMEHNGAELENSGKIESQIIGKSK
ncbi:MAG: hypothetical protein PHW12_01550 [Smithella sp.]|nr:hypothetical protein [Smithella sp.]MDD5672854.1 hypothetical protein [Chitinivibrionales bacterium]